MWLLPWMYSVGLNALGCFFWGRRVGLFVLIYCGGLVLRFGWVLFRVVSAVFWDCLCRIT